MSYDAEGNLSTWQNQPTPTSTMSYLYDGEGARVASQMVSGGNTTLTSYIGKLETVVTGSSTTTTTYYSAGGLRIAEAVNATFSYLGNDVLGSTAVALNASGQLTAAQLYGPYGNVRYSSGTMPTDIGFTGQRGDSATGLDYYGARYYDPVVGQFISADTVLPGNGFDPWGLSRYAYVRGNPETWADPTGHADPYLYYVAAWYGSIHPGRGIEVDSQAFAIPNSQVPGDDVPITDWSKLYNTGTARSGRPDIVNRTLHVVWEVKKRRYRN